MSTLSRRRVTSTSNATPDPAPHLPTLDLDELVPQLTLMDEVVLLGIKDKEGYLSFWNDCISYALRGCILVELALRGRIAVGIDAANRDATTLHKRTHAPVADRPLVILSEKLTGEVLLDETLRLIKSATEPTSILQWINLLSGETWNISKIGFQLKQVRERLAKGLVEKGVLRTEKRNFLLFDMATHPVQDVRIKTTIVRKCLESLHTSQQTVDTLGPDTKLRQHVLICAAYAANVLENAFSGMAFEERERSFERADTLMQALCVWPNERSEYKLMERDTNIKRECLEVVAGVVSVFSKMDSVI